MEFQIDRIYRNNTNGKKPLTVKFTTPSEEPGEDIYSIDLAERHLQSVKTFRKAVATRFGIRLGNPSARGQAHNRKKNWAYLIAQAFAAGKVGQVSEVERPTEAGEVSACLEIHKLAFELERLPASIAKKIVETTQKQIDDIKEIVAKAEKGYYAIPF